MDRPTINPGMSTSSWSDRFVNEVGESGASTYLVDGAEADKIDADAGIRHLDNDLV